MRIEWPIACGIMSSGGLRSGANLTPRFGAIYIYREKDGT